MYCWDASVWAGCDYATQHQMFVRECLVTLKRDLQTIGLTLIEFECGILEALTRIAQHYHIGGIYSYEETGNLLSYELDKAVAAWCHAQGVAWHEFTQNGVVRRLKNRDTWAGEWEKRMHAPQTPVPHHASMAVQVVGLETQSHQPNVMSTLPDKPLRQRGGRDEALKVLHTFLNGRASRYRGGISSPLSSEQTGSRISPYLTWGALSMREVVQGLRQQKLNIQKAPSVYPKGLMAGLVGFESRLHWHCHFMQKLESEPEMECRNLHPLYHHMRDEVYASEASQARLQAWCNGQTGWPLVDACMAMLRETGWVNFRMRAMLMSTASYLLWLHWRQTGLHLAREFLDYEPGIHWPQVQMQSGTTGINTLRIYNPVKQAMDQDPEGVYVRRWLPALRNVPNTWIFQPWLMPEALQQAYGCKIGVDYPAPLVGIEQALKYARAQFSQQRLGKQYQATTAQIIKKHASRKPSPAKREKKTFNLRQQPLF